MPADIYLIDEPSACKSKASCFGFGTSSLTAATDLDSEQRIVASRVIKRFIMHAKKTAFIVEHDFIMATYLADRVIVFDGEPGINAHANKPESLLTGCNSFLKNLDVTFRRDPTNFRPRINKLNSQLDQEQKLNGNYVSSSHQICRDSWTNPTRFSSSWKIWTRVVKEGIPKDTHGNGHDTSRNDALDGVLGVQKGGVCKNRAGGARGDANASEDGAISEDDDPDI
jgi:ATP-binding cassette subfamily E protein 1